MNERALPTTGGATCSIARRIGVVAGLALAVTACAQSGRAPVVDLDVPIEEPPPELEPIDDLVQPCQFRGALPKLGLSIEGRLALLDLIDPPWFGGWAIGRDRAVGKPVEAYRTIMREPNGTEALTWLADHACPAGQLFGLTGLYDADPDRLDERVYRFVTRDGGVMFLDDGASKPSPRAITAIVKAWSGLDADGDILTAAEVEKQGGWDDIVGGALAGRMRENSFSRARPLPSFELDVSCREQGSGASTRARVTSAMEVVVDLPRRPAFAHAIPRDHHAQIAKLLASDAFETFVGETPRTIAADAPLVTCTLALTSADRSAERAWRSDERLSPQSHAVQRRLVQLLEPFAPLPSGAR